MTDDTFQTYIPNDGNRAGRMIGTLNTHMWSAWKPGVGFPYQAGSGYGNMNDQIIPAPVGQYQTNLSLGYGGTRAQEAQRNRGQPTWLIALRKWWKGE